MREILEYRPERVTAEGLKGFFADVLVTLDAHPRQVDVRVSLSDGPDAVIDLADGNPVFGVLTGGGHAAAEVLAASDFRRRWLAEHPVPLVLRAARTTRLRFIPTDANRLKVRAA